MTLSEFFLDYYLPYVKSYKRSWTTDECMIRVHLVRRLGHFVMAQMKPPDIAQFVVQMREAGYTYPGVGVDSLWIQLGCEVGVPGIFTQSHARYPQPAR